MNVYDRNVTKYGKNKKYTFRFPLLNVLKVPRFRFESVKNDVNPYDYSFMVILEVFLGSVF